MAESRGTYGRVKVFEDFLAPDAALTWSTSAQRLGQVGQVSVNEGTFAHTVDESGGVIALTTDTGDNDNVALYAGPFVISDGGCSMEARFKVDSITTAAVLCGFQTGLVAATPVMSAEYATATLTVNEAGSSCGMLWDPDGTTDYWMAFVGNDSAAKVSSPVSTTQTLVADEYDVVRVEIGTDGSGDIYLAEKGGILKLIKHFPPATLTVGDIVYPVLFCENRDGSANVLEVDYFFAEGGRDWTR